MSAIQVWLAVGVTSDAQTHRKCYFFFNLY